MKLFKNENFELLKRAQREKWAIGQFNISNLETLKAIIEAAKGLNSPVIIGTSERESRFLGLKQVVALVGAFKKENSFPILLNLDHGKDLDYIKKAIDEGYDCVQFDGSSFSLEENIRMTKEIVKYARKNNVLVEGEVGSIKGSSEVLKSAPEIKEEDLTNPKEALRFIKETGVDSLAVNAGSFHGVLSKGETERINFRALNDIKSEIKDSAFLVLHGGSGINREDVKKAIELGVVKVNINTDLRVAFTNSLKNILINNPEEIVPVKYMPEVVIAVKSVVEDKIKLFNSDNKI